MKIFGARADGREISTVLLGSVYKEGCWRVEIKLALTDLGFEPGKPGTFAAQFQRHRALRGNVNAKEKEKGTDYFWMPPMKPPWGEQFRFGQVRFER